MPQQQAFGGDDDSTDTPQEQPVKKPVLHKFASKPDMNIREMFWDLIAEYALKKKYTPEELRAIYNERMALMRIALSVLQNPQSAYLGLSSNFTTLYTFMLFFDAGWEDAIEEFIAKSYEEKEQPSSAVIAVVKKLYEQPEYKEKISELVKKMIRMHDKTKPILAYLTKIQNKEILALVKKELIIIAKNDIEENQRNAMIALSHSMDDESRSVLGQLLMHWDEEVRYLAAIILQNEKDPKIIEVAKRQSLLETNQSIKKLLDKIYSEVK